MLPLRMVLVLFLIFSVQSSLAVDWAHLTAEELGQLPPSDFANATAEDLASIPTAACVGFNAESDQLSAIPPASFAGLSWPCLYNISLSALKVISAAQISAAHPTTFANMTSSFAVSLSQLAIPGFTIPQIAAFDTFCTILPGSYFLNFLPENYAGFRSACLAAIPALSFKNLNAAGVGNFDPTQVDGISADAMMRIETANFTVEAVSHFNPSTGCLGISDKVFSSLPFASYFGFTRECLAAINPVPYQSATPQGVALFNPTQVNGITKGFQYFGRNANFTIEATKHFNASDGCSQIPQYFFQGFPATSYFGFRLDCLGLILPSSYDGFTSFGLGNLDPTQVNGIPPNALLFYMKSIEVMNFTKESVLNFNTTTCAYLEIVMYRLPWESYAGLLSDCLNAITDHTYSTFTSPGIGNLDPTQVKGIRASGMSKIGTGNNQIANFTREAVKNFDASRGCKGIPKELIATLPLTSFFGFQSGCLRSIPIQSYVAWNADQVSNLDPLQINGIYLSSLPKSGAEGLTGEQVGNFSGTSCQQLPTQVWEGIKAPIYSAFTSECLSNVGWTGCTGIYAEGLSNIGVDVVDSIQRRCVNALTNEAVSGWTVAQVKQFNLLCPAVEKFDFWTDSALEALTPDCIWNTQAPAWQNLRTNQPALLSVEQTASIQPIAVIPIPTLKAFSIPQLESFAVRGINTLLNAQQLYSLCTYRNLTFIRMYAPEAFTPNTYQISNFNQYFVNGDLQPFIHQNETKPELLTWLEMEFVLEVPELLDLNISVIPGEALAGLRSSFTSEINASVFARFNASHVAWLPRSVFTELSKEQLEVIPAKSFANVTYDTFAEFPGPHIPWITVDQVAQWTELQPTLFTWIKCDQVISFSPAQQMAFSEQSVPGYRNRMNQCGNPTPPPFPPMPVPVAPGPEPEPNPEPQPVPAEFPPGIIIGVSVGLGAALIGAIVIAVIVIMRRNRSNDYQMIGTDD